MVLVLLLLTVYGPSNQLDINRASLDEMLELPVASCVAEGIFDYVQSYGRMNSVYDLMRVEGMSAAKLDELKPMVYVSAEALTGGPAAGSKSVPSSSNSRLTRISRA